MAGMETIRIPNEPDRTNYFVIYGKSFLVRSKSGHIKTTSSVRILTAHQIYDEGGESWSGMNLKLLGFALLLLPCTF